MFKKLLRKVLSREFLLYMLFGVVTTATNYLVFGFMQKVLGEGSALVSNAVAFVASVLVAYLTNKPFVFKSKSWHWKVVCRELVTFVGSRLATFGFEEIGLFICQDLLHMDSWQWLGLNGLLYAKLALSVVVIIVNYIFSKFVAFRKPEDTQADET